MKTCQSHGKTVIIELQYMPPIEYFVHLIAFEKIVIDTHDKYIKQTYRNRCRIRGANKIEDLVIPVLKGRGQGKLTCEVEIDYKQKWLGKHKRAIASAYGKAPFFEYYADELFAILDEKPSLLFELNKKLLTKCLEFLEIKSVVEFSDLDDVGEKDSYFAKNTINPKRSSATFQIFKPKKYFQVFGKDFAENLSIIDLIFNEGPEARGILENSLLLNRQN